MGGFRPQNPWDETGFKRNQEVAGVPPVEGTPQHRHVGYRHLTPSYAAIRPDNKDRKSVV